MMWLISYSGWKNEIIDLVLDLKYINWSKVMKIFFVIKVVRKWKGKGYVLVKGRNLLCWVIFKYFDGEM